MGTLSTVDRAWLAGFVDGEGCIAIYGSQRVATVQVVTSCPVSRERLVTLFTALGAPPRVYSRPVTNPVRHRQTWVLAVRRVAHIERIAAALRPYAVTKAPQWALIHEWCTTRMGRGVARDSVALARDQRITADLKLLNTSGPREVDLQFERTG